MTLAATNNQIPDNSILDANNKQTYLGNQYSVTSTFTVGTSEIPLILLQNNQSGYPNLANQSRALFQNLLKVLESSATSSVILKVYLNPTVSATGTPLTPVNLRSSYGVASSKASPFSAPTITANGTLVDALSAAPSTVSLSSLLKILDNGQSLLVTGTSSAASNSVSVLLEWFEL